METDNAFITTRQGKALAVGFVKSIADTDPVETIDGVDHCRFCGAAKPDEGHDGDCIWIEASQIAYPRRPKFVDQPRQDVHDFLVQLQTYRSYKDPITMTIQTLNANLGTKACDRIEQAIMKRLLEVHPGDVFKEGA